MNPREFSSCQHDFWLWLFVYSITDSYDVKPPINNKTKFHMNEAVSQSPDHLITYTTDTGRNNGKANHNSQGKGG